jgi:hypothetical protein
MRPAVASRRSLAEPYLRLVVASSKRTRREAALTGKLPSASEPVMAPSVLPRLSLRAAFEDSRRCERERARRAGSLISGLPEAASTAAGPPPGLGVAGLLEHVRERACAERPRLARPACGQGRPAAALAHPDSAPAFSRAIRSPRAAP